MKDISNERASAKRIVLNSFMLFFRMLFVSVLSLYSVRFVLRGLSLDGYGLFNAVSGIVLTGTFIIPVLAISIQRFYSYALGEGDLSKLTKIFSVSVNIIFFAIVLLVALFETLGLWYINSHLVIPDEYQSSVNLVYQVTLLSFVFSLCLIPYTALLFSHEQMGVYAFLSCFESLLKFSLAVSILYCEADRIVFYSLGLLAISFVMLLFYVGYSMKHYDECRYCKVRDLTIYRDLLTFSGWTTYGAATGTAIIQGSVVAINFFFGTLSNAAFGVANNIYNALNSLANSVVLAFRPAMVKAYAQGDYSIVNRLFDINNKVALYMMGAFTIPAVFEMRFLLECWLEKISSEMVIFSQLFSIYTLCMVMHNPVTNIIQSSGDIKRYTLLVNSIMLLGLPSAIVLFLLGAPSYTLFLAHIVCCVFAHFARLYCLKRQYSEFSFSLYLKEIMIRGSSVFAITTLLTWWLHNEMDPGWLRFVSTFLLSPSILLFLAFFVGLSQYQRVEIVNIVKKKFLCRV